MSVRHSLGSVAITVGLILVSVGVMQTSQQAEQVQAATGVHFSTAGDYSSSSAAGSVFNSIKALNPDLHLALGDLSYSTTLSEEGWCDLVTSRIRAGFPFELLAGNHESNGENGSINNFSACLPNQLPGLVGTYGRQYYVDVPAVNPLVRYVMISPGLTFPDGPWSYSAGSARYNWTATAIDGARSNGIPWVVVGMHKPCLSMGIYSCESGADLLNLLLSKRVDLVLSGHEHIYQRTFQLATQSGCTAVAPGTFNGACIADSDSTMSKGAGTVFATVGTGGVPFRDVNTSDSEAGFFAARSGANANPTWGVLDINATETALAVQFERASGGTFTDTFAIDSSTPTNAPPSPAFTQTCTALSCSFDAASSTDPDGSISGFAWDFGDGANGTGVTTQHAFAAAGTYTVTLTATDDDGATGRLSRSIIVTSPNSTAIAEDSFSRSVTNGWGSATTGGAWTVAGSLATIRVADGTGQFTLAAGATRTANLETVSAASADITLTCTLDRAPSGGGTYIGVVGRKVGDASYFAQAWLKSTGAVSLIVQQGTTAIASLTVPGLTYTAGGTLKFRLQVKGSSPTTIRAKVWLATQPEPTIWHIVATDSAPTLQVPGSVGVRAYHSSSSTTPVLARFDDFIVQPAP